MRNRDHIDEHILNKIGECLADGPGMEFDARDFFALVGSPIVYIVSNDQEVLYVGVSQKGLQRPAQHDHKTLHSIAGISQSVKIYRCRTEEAAILAEKLLIALLQPRYNKRLKNVSTEDVLAA